MSRLKTLAFVPAIVLALPQPAAAQEAPLAQVNSHLRAVDTMTANFSQTDRRGQVLSGVLTLKRPGRLRFQYQQGVPMLIVADGKRLWVIDYETRRKDSWPIGNSPLGILTSANPDLSRIAKVVRNDGQSLIVEARDPKKPQFGTITLGFSKTASAPAGLLLQGWTVIDAQNNRTTVRLSNQRFNVAVADSTFRFEDPSRRGPKG